MNERVEGLARFSDFWRQKGINLLRFPVPAWFTDDAFRSAWECVGFPHTHHLFRFRLLEKKNDEFLAIEFASMGTSSLLCQDDSGKCIFVEHDSAQFLNSSILHFMDCLVVYESAVDAANTELEEIFEEDPEGERLSREFLDSIGRIDRPAAVEGSFWNHLATSV